MSVLEQPIVNPQPSADFDVDTPIDQNYHQIESDRLKRWEETLSAEYWSYREAWNEYPKQRIVGEVPLHLDIEATSNCNLRCTMCPRTELVERGEFWKVENVDFEQYAKLIDHGVKHGLKSVKYNYLGEPLMNPRLIEMIRYAKQRGVVDVMFNTNATLLTERVARQLIESGLDKLFFSFDSPNREHYQAIRINANYDKVLHNIRRFHQIRDELGAIKPFTRVSMVVMRENQAELTHFRRLFEPIVDAVAYVDYLDHTGQSNPDKTVVPLGQRQSKFCCPQLWQRMFVNSDGVVTVCCSDSARELKIGNAFEQSLHEIWTGDAYQRLRDLHASGRSAEVPICARCPLAQY